MKTTECDQSRRLDWQIAEVVEIKPENDQVRTIALRLASWSGHQPGQHVDIRLTAPDGYQAQRSYSIASSPLQPLLELTIERVKDGEVSEYLVDVLQTGDRLELRGPIGRYFVWTGATDRPLWLIGGGSGIVPLMAMLRHRHDGGRPIRTCLVSSFRTVDRIINREELERMSSGDQSLQIVQTLTRSSPEGWGGKCGRVNRGMLAECDLAPDDRPRVFICGPVPFVEAISHLLIDMGYDPFDIRTERFGPYRG